MWKGSLRRRPEPSKAPTCENGNSFDQRTWSKSVSRVPCWINTYGSVSLVLPSRTEELRSRKVRLHLQLELQGRMIKDHGRLTPGVQPTEARQCGAEPRKPQRPVSKAKVEGDWRSHPVSPFDLSIYMCTNMYACTRRYTHMNTCTQKKKLKNLLGLWS